MRKGFLGNALIRLIRCLALLLPLALPHVATAGEQAPAATLLFFLNPNGQPCQIQSQIIDGIRPQIEQRARIVPVSTADSSNMDRFRQYGVRYLPLLILVDGDQKEIKRFPPGIQPAEEILKEVAALGEKAS
ncbi:MAG: hypothetical protein HC900_08665 [Methylacidiphilales bacterium]|nr:hypothetical protein [Candidatus Methylacidiphilales bacterium]